MPDAPRLALTDLSAWNGVRAKVRYVDDGGVRRAESVMVSRERMPAPQDLSGSPAAASGMTSPKRSAIR